MIVQVLIPTIQPKKTPFDLNSLPADSFSLEFNSAKKKLIIIGSFDMMADGHGNRRRSKTNYAHNLAKLVKSKW
jgi:hypothetical protein